MRYPFFLLIFCLLFASPVFALNLKSNAFENDKSIPEKYTCNAADASPALLWSEVPAGVQSFVVICEDPGAAFGSWVHWVIYNIPKDATQLKEGIGKASALYDGMGQGINDFKKIGYNGPCPPAGKSHGYVFTLYALDTTISVLTRSVTKNDIAQAMRGHIIEEARVTGTYELTKEERPFKGSEKTHY